MGKYKVTRTRRPALFGLAGETEEVRVTNTQTGQSARAGKWDYEKKDILQEAIDKLRANE